jgi:hypothetical protein
MSVEFLYSAEAQLVGDKWHILTFAECGFSPLDIYCREPIGQATMNKFADQINQCLEVGTLYPVFQLSAVPRPWIRGPRNDDALERAFVQFLEMIRDEMHGTELVVDFSIPKAPRFAIERLKAALERVPDSGITRVVVVGELGN